MFTDLYATIHFGATVRGANVTLFDHFLYDVTGVHVDCDQGAQGDAGLLRQLATDQVDDVAQLWGNTAINTGSAHLRRLKSYFLAPT